MTSARVWRAGCRARLLRSVLVSVRSCCLFLLCLAFEGIILFHDYSTAAPDINNVCCFQVALFLQRTSQARWDSSFYWASCRTFIEKLYCMNRDVELTKHTSHSLMETSVWCGGGMVLLICTEKSIFSNYELTKLER